MTDDKHIHVYIFICFAFDILGIINKLIFEHFSRQFCKIHYPLCKYCRSNEHAYNQEDNLSCSVRVMT